MLGRGHAHAHLPPMAQAGPRVGAVFTHLVLLAGALVMVIPFIWMLSTAFKPEWEVLSLPPRWLPVEPTLENFSAVLKGAPFGRYFLNSLLMSSLSTLGILATSVTAGYALGKFEFPGAGLLFMAVLATAIVPFEIYMIPLYLQMRQLGLIDTMAGMVVPYLIMSYGIFFMRQNVIHSIPAELVEAARIDGASEGYIFLRVVLPLLKSPMSALAIFAFTQAWTAFIWPLLIAGRQELYTMELGLAMFQTGFAVNFGLMNAASVLAVAPVVIVFLVLRRQIIEGVTLTGIKM